MRYHAQLDWLNFFLADVRGGLGPYVDHSLTQSLVFALLPKRRTERATLLVDSYRMKRALDEIAELGVVELVLSVSPDVHPGYEAGPEAPRRSHP